MATAQTATQSRTRGAKRAEQLRALAFDLFAKKGFDATSMDDIALAAGVSKRTPYIYFKNKHDLFSAVVLVFLTEIERRLDAIWDSAGSALDALISAADAYAAYAIENPAHFDLIMTFERRDFYPGRAQELPVNAQACQDVNNRITERMYEVIETAKRAGELQTGLTTKQYGLLLWASLVGVVSIAVERRALLPDVYGWHAEEMVRAHIAHFFSSSTSEDGR
jgi:AcrR family transcriptional regulator